MLKLLLHRQDRKAVVLGLTGENIARLVNGEPIHVRLEDLGVPGIDVIIDYRKTADDLADPWVETGLIAPEIAKATKGATPR
jgi:hypothetical protein